MSKLVSNGLVLLCLIGKRSDITERTPAASNGAIAVWAAKTAMQSEFMDFFSIPASKIPTKHID